MSQRSRHFGPSSIYYHKARLNNDRTVFRLIPGMPGW